MGRAAAPMGRKPLLSRSLFAKNYLSRGTAPIAFSGPLAKMAAGFRFNRGFMRGQVLGVDTRTGDGMVAGDDGRRYAFKPADWAARGEPAVGMQVDFEIQENRALSIFPVPGTTPSPVPAARASAEPEGSERDKLIAALLAFLLGTLGVHRFYLGRIGSGIAMLLLSCTVIGLFVTVPWALIDMIRYLVMSNGEFAQRYARR